MTDDRTPREELEEIMNAGLGFAESMLESHGEFVPFGMALGADGEVQAIGTRERPEPPPSSELVERLQAAFVEGARAGALDATALFCDVRVSHVERGELDAVQVCLEHRGGECLDVFVPYTIEDAAVAFHEPFAGRRDPTVFEPTP